MNMIWILAIVAAVGTISAIVWLPRRSNKQDLGAVSHQWIAEHRLGHPNDSRS